MNLLVKFDDIITKIRFIPEGKKNKEKKEVILNIIDEALKNGGDLGVYGDLNSGIKSLVEIFYITITEHKKDYFIDCGPLSGSGHDFQFSVNKKKKRIDMDSIVIGEVISEPDE